MHDLRVTFDGGNSLRLHQLNDAALTLLEDWLATGELVEVEPGGRERFKQRLEIERVIRAKGLTSE